MCQSLAPVGVISSACTVFRLGDNSRNYVRIPHRWPANVAGYRSSGVLTVVQSPVDLDSWCQCNWFLTSSNTFPTSFPGITLETRLSKRIERERGPWIPKVWILTLLSGCFPDACKLFQGIWCDVNLTLSCYRVFDPLHPNIDMFILRFTWYWQGEFV